MNKPAIPSIDLVELQAKHEQAWRPAYQQFLRLVKARGLTSGVELGVGFGGHCEALLDYRGIDTLVGVDPYTHQPGIDDATNFTQPEMDRLYDRVLHRLARFGRRFELMRDTSRNAARHFEDGSLDFVYIDADHRFDAVADDLGAWFDKVREGGILAGHDYDNPELPDVQQAVDGYFQRLGWTVNHAGDHVWWVQKRRASISYLIPAYNAEETLWQAVASVMEDNFVGGDECIVVDDGSTDATGQVLDELSECYPSLRVIVHDQNYGAAVARNRAVRDANHDLVFMLDADNVLPTDSVAPLRQHLLRHNADAVCCGTIHLFRDGDEPDQTAWTHRYEQTHATLGQYCG
ncbi:MAG: glycosyltransferase, partial [Phycisphaeraceae bacterium]